MGKFDITPEELQQSLDKMKVDTLAHLSNILYEATKTSTRDCQDDAIKTPMHDVLDSLFAAVVIELNKRNEEKLPW